MAAMADDGHLIDEEKVKTQADIVVAHTRPQAPAHTMTTKTTRDASIFTRLLSMDLRSLLKFAHTPAHPNDRAILLAVRTCHATTTI